MRKLIIFLIFLVFIFLINYVFYIVSEDYRFFIKKIKDPEDVVYVDKEVIDDKIKIDNKKEEELKKEKAIENKILEDAKVVETSKKNEEIFDTEDNSKEVELKKEVVLWKSYQKILEKFSTYDLQPLEINTNLFDLTDEYPDNYLEYYWENLTLYFFPTKGYRDVVDIFTILQDELPFNIKEVNNFWEASFYINLDKDIEDRFIRIVISYEWVAFWIKVKKTDYSLVKAKLILLKPTNNTKKIIPVEDDNKPSAE